VRRFKPVDAPVSFDGRVSQTALRHYARCPRSAYLYQRYRGEGSSPEMQRGSAVHAVHERAVRAMMDAREMAHRIGGELVIPEDPNDVVSCETLFVLDIAGWQVRCRIDYAELRDDGASVYVADVKSAKGAPGYEEIARKRPDGTLAAKSMQLILYALVLAYGVPVREWWEPCVDCDGEPSSQHLVTGEQGCEACSNRGGGRIEAPEPSPVAARAQRFDLEFVYPGIEDREGKIVRRPVSLTRLELEEYRASLVGLLERLSNSEATGDWPAVASDAACAECPAKPECPIPSELRDHRGTINSLEDASEAAEALYREKALLAARQRELREFAKAHDVAVPFGLDMEWRLVYSEYEKVPDRVAYEEAVMRAVEFGEPFDRARFVRVQGKTDFRPVQLTAGEIEDRQRQEGSDGHTEEDRDERWGASAPF
jgi:hypothetical protein